MFWGVLHTQQLFDREKLKITLLGRGGGGGWGL